MGKTTYDGLIKTVVAKCGKNTSNQSLRPSTFNAQDMLGMTPAQKRTVSGHINEKTAGNS